MSDQLTVSTAAKEFLEALQKADPLDWVRPPGLPGPYRAKHVSAGLMSGAMAIHRSGHGLCWGTSISPTDKGDVVRLKPEVYQLERDMQTDDAWPKASPEAVKKLLTAFNRINFGLDKAPKVEDKWAL